MRGEHAVGNELGDFIHALHKFLARARNAETDVVDVATGAVGHEADEAVVLAQRLLNEPGEHTKVIGRHAARRNPAHIMQRVIGQ